MRFPISEFPSFRFPYVLILLSWIVCSPSIRANDVADLGVSFPVQGTVRDMSDRTQFSGLTFQVELQDIRYDGQVQRVLLQEKEADCMTVWLSLRDLKVTINRTDILGGRRSALCGPLHVLIGTREEAWIAFEVGRDGSGDDAKLVVESTRFGFADHNWTVGAPAWVRSSGLGMTQARVVSGLRTGLAKRRADFEQQIMQVAPPMFKLVEGHVERRLQDERLALK